MSNIDNVFSLDNEISALQITLKKSEQARKESEEKLSVLTAQLEQLKCMITALGLDYKHFSKSKRQSNSTSKSMISDSSSSTRHRHTLQEVSAKQGGMRIDPSIQNGRRINLKFRDCVFVYT